MKPGYTSRANPISDCGTAAAVSLRESVKFGLWPQMMFNLAIAKAKREREYTGKVGFRKFLSIL